MDRFVSRTPRVKENIPPQPPKPSSSDQNIPDPNTFVHPQIAHAANEAAKMSMEISNRKRKSYNIFSDDVKLKIGKYAAESGVPSAIRKFQGSLTSNLKQQTVNDWKHFYLKNVNTENISFAKRGRPVALGEEIDAKVCNHVKRLRDEGSVVTRSIVLSVARAYLQHLNPTRFNLEGNQIAMRFNVLITDVLMSSHTYRMFVLLIVSVCF
jgi:hypothetical protein